MADSGRNTDKNIARLNPHGILSLLFVLSFLSACFAGLLTLIHTPGPLEEDQVLDIVPGTPAVQIISQLQALGAVSHPQLFSVLFRLKGEPLRAGEFRIPARSSVAKIHKLLTRGQTVRYSLTIVEGATVHHAYELVKAAENLTGDLPPEALAAEGSLAASTYYYVKGDSRENMISRMEALQKRWLDEFWQQKSESHPLTTREEIIILASMIERETAVAGERHKIAGVFVNRLKRGMRLQSDPTVIYGLTLGKSKFGRRLTRKDLKTDTPYNTYTRNGLPASAIALPGPDSLLAALTPEEHDYLYFVANGKGGHEFAKTLTEHNRNVAEWRALKRETKRETP